MASLLRNPGSPTVPGSSTSERAPLLRQDTSRPDTARPKGPRNVTFNPNPVTRTIDPDPFSSLSSSPRTGPVNPFGNGRPGSASASSGNGAPNAPGLSTLNSRLRRRNSHGAVFTSLPPAVGSGAKIGPQRSSKNAQKLKLLPNLELEEDEAPDEESGRDVYSQYTRIKDPMARRDAARLGKADRERLPRVTAYCTANKYQMEGLMRFLKGKTRTRTTSPKLIDECIYTPYNYGTNKTIERTETDDQIRERPAAVYERRHSTGQVEEHSDSYRRQDLMDLHSNRQREGSSGSQDSFNEARDMHNDLAYPPHPDEESAIHDPPSSRTQTADFDTNVHTPEVFLFDYGVVVIWGMSLAHEQRFLKEIAKFEEERLEPDDVETECFNFYYTREYQPRIYNDFITLRDKGNYMTKLAISHALAQSVKVSEISLKEEGGGGGGGGGPPPPPPPRQRTRGGGEKCEQRCGGRGVV